MIRINSQSAEYIFFWPEDRNPDMPDHDPGIWELAEMPFGSSQQAVLFVRRFNALMEFRGLLNQKFPGQTFQWRIEEIHNKLAELLARGRLRVLKRWKRATGSPAAAADAPKAVRREAPAEQREQAEPPTLDRKSTL